MLRQELKRVVHKQMLATELKQYCKEEQAKISPQLCERLIKKNYDFKLMLVDLDNENQC